MFAYLLETSGEKISGKNDIKLVGQDGNGNICSCFGIWNIDQSGIKGVELVKEEWLCWQKQQNNFGGARARESLSVVFAI